MTENNKIHEEEIKEIDLIVLFRKLYSNRKKIYKSIGIGIIAGVIIGLAYKKNIR